MKFIAKHVHTDENPNFILLYGSLPCIRCMLPVVYKELYVSATQDNSLVVIRMQLLITLCKRALFSGRGSGAWFRDIVCHYKTDMIAFFYYFLECAATLLDTTMV